MRLSILEEHQPDHQVRNRREFAHSHRLEELGRRRPARGIAHQDMQNVFITCHHPGMQERIPVHGILLPKIPVERIRVGEDLWVEQSMEAELRIRKLHRGVATVYPFYLRRSFEISFTSAVTLGAWKSWRSVSATPKSFRIRTSS